MEKAVRTFSPRVALGVHSGEACTPPRSMYSAPRFDVNPNTGEPLGRHRRMIEADNTIHHSSATHPSHIVLPLVPSGR